MREKLRSWVNSLAPRLKEADELPLTLASLVAGAVSLLLVWGFTYPPFIDAANVAYSGEVMHDLWRGGAVYGKWYAFRSGAMSHMAFYWLYHALRAIFAPVVCVKLLATVGVLGLPLAMRGLLRAMNRTLWLSVPAFALAFNTNLNMGYLPFVIGVPLIPVSLMLIEQNANQPRAWRCVALATVLIGSLWVHFFLTAILLPLATLWSLLCLRGRSRRWFVALITIALTVAASVVFLRSSIPAWQRVFQWIPYSERWDQLDRDVLQWTTDGLPALSFPLLLLAFVASLVLTHRTPTSDHGLRAARGALGAALLFGAYLLGPNYISWPEPAWGFGTRIGIAFALCLLLVPTTSATGWGRVVQVSPWLAFTAFHLASLLGPFRAYAAVLEPLAVLHEGLPPHATILPLYDSEWLKDPARYSFGGFTGFVFKHAGKWLAVETDGYQPWSFCDAGYHPIECVARLPAPSQATLSLGSSESLNHYDYLLLRQSAATPWGGLSKNSWSLLRKSGEWSLWRNISGTQPSVNGPPGQPSPTSP